ncbi:MAG: hypothetical protein LBH34_01510 [Prevotellaceae bacterium]|jgi:hypothetical protein|nr:hypothetical protein [Prevotellaceae bacterium]
MKWKRYPIRAAKYVFYFYILLLIIYALMYLMGVTAGSDGTKPLDWHALFNVRLMIGLSILGLSYPLIGFNTMTIEMPAGDHDRGIKEAVELCGYKLKSVEEGKMHFVALSMARRVLAMFEEDIWVEFNNGNTIKVSGLRKDVARVRLRINDYLRDLNGRGMV